MTERISTTFEAVGVLLIAFGGFKLAEWLGYVLLGVGFLLFGLALSR